MAKTDSPSPAVAIPKENPPSLETKAPNKPTDPGSKQLKIAFTKSTPLYLSPPTCGKGDDYGATDYKKKYSALKSYPVSAIAEKEKTFTVLAPSVDCETNAWKLIKLSSGETGWIKNDVLEKNTAKLMVADVKCKSAVDNKCVQSLNTQLKDYKIETKNNEFFAKPYSKSKTANFSNADWECREKSDSNDPWARTVGAISGYGTSGGMGMGTGMAFNVKPPISRLEAPKNTTEDLDSFLSQLDEKEKAFEKKLPIKS